MAICVGHLFMKSLGWWSLAGKGLLVKTDGQEEKEGAVKLRKPCWASPAELEWIPHEFLLMLGIKRQHIILMSLVHVDKIELVVGLD